MEVYLDYAHCFACGYRVSTATLGSRGISLPEGPSRASPVDLQADLERIKSLPLARVRGLDLPVDSDSYYILFPGSSYYKRRKFFPGDGPKYLCPKGHAKPLFIAHDPKGADKVAIIEGEANALSLATLKPSFAICSPGGVGSFNEKELNDLHFSKYLLILDRDKAGLAAAIKAREFLVKRSPYVEIVLMEEDLNDLLQSGRLEDEAKARGWI